MVYGPPAGGVGDGGGLGPGEGAEPRPREMIEEPPPMTGPSLPSQQPDTSPSSPSTFIGGGFEKDKCVWEGGGCEGDAKITRTGAYL